MTSDEWVSFVSVWQPRIRAFFARRCRDRDDVDDLVQEAIASIVRCHHTFSHRSTLSTWVYAVCRNTLSNYLYYRDRDYRLVRRLGADPPPAESPLPMAVRDAIGQLPKDGERLYLLYYVQGLSVRQISTVLDRPEGTVKYLLHGLRQRIRELLEA